MSRVHEARGRLDVVVQCLQRYVDGDPQLADLVHLIGGQPELAAQRRVDRQPVARQLGDCLPGQVPLEGDVL